MPKRSIPKICSANDCNETVKANGLCPKHNWRYLRYGDANTVSHIYGDDERRFYSYLEMIPESGCWIWTGAINNGGYGRIGIGKKTTTAHRYSYQINVGEIPDGLFVLHKCDVRCCANPDHLFLGTPTDNMQDMVKKGRCGQRGKKLTDADVAAIRRSLQNFSGKGTRTALANEYGVHPDTITRIWRGHTWL